MSTTSALPLIRSRQWAFDLALTAVIGVFTVTPEYNEGRIQFLLALFLVFPLMARRAFPGIALTVAAVAAFGQAIALQEPTFSIVTVPIMVYSLARWCTKTYARAALGVGLFGALIGPASWLFSDGPYGYSTLGDGAGTVIAFAMTGFACAATVASAYLVGRRRNDSVRNRAQQAVAEAEQQRLMVAEQVQRANVATVNERNRIARELHDIVAHSLSVIVVQAEGGKAIAAKKPELAPEVLGTIAETSREALEEMRRMVGLLRNGGSAAGVSPESAQYVPTPGLADIPDLVRKTGDQARLVVHGEVPAVSQALGLSAYRIVQESLTNVLKHGGPRALVEVAVAYPGASVELEITDDGRGSAATSDGMGHGLRGMHERVALHSGRLTAQPRVGGGFMVRASLPIGPDPQLQAQNQAR